MLLLNDILYPKYNNKILSISNVANVLNPLMLGNSGTYDLTYIVKTSLGETLFKYHIFIKKDDNGHANGPYDLFQCVLKPKNVSFVAGNYEHFPLELRNKKVKRIII